ncbi:MAG: hypothetical protein JRF27_04555 [Deltaproteobacteria bacterium]|nr:hypothetical protein [Deltaproteobacteria bacterium]
MLFLIWASYFLYRLNPGGFFFLVPLYVGLSFFMFCNLFRIGNRLESVWYVPFVIITLICLNRPDIYWKRILIICEPLKIGLVIYRIKKGGYTGIFYKQLAKHEARTAR